jgi:hypothetical protein
MSSNIITLLAKQEITTSAAAQPTSESSTELPNISQMAEMEVNSLKADEAGASDSEKLIT